MLGLLRRLLPYSWPIRVALGIMFLLSAAGKIGDLNGVVEEVRQYNLLPEPLVVPFGYLLPFGELALGITLTLGLFTRLAAAGGALLMVSFMVAIAYRLLLFGEAEDCGCFGLLGQERLTWWTFGRDVVFLVGLMFPLFDTAHYASIDRWLFGWGTGDEDGTTALEESESDSGAGVGVPDGPRV
jgi:uncharacterized membrane protein YphA (DoxX/SURF4 family)